jgi:hypothetical protein
MVLSDLWSGQNHVVQHFRLVILKYINLYCFVSLWCRHFAFPEYPPMLTTNRELLAATVSLVSLFLAS